MKLVDGCIDRVVESAVGDVVRFDRVRRVEVLYPWKEMEPGDSFFVPGQHFKGVNVGSFMERVKRSAGKVFVARGVDSWRVRCRLLSCGGMRIWVLLPGERVPLSGGSGRGEKRVFAYAVESGVQWESVGSKYPWSEMAAGDSFLVPGDSFVNQEAEMGAIRESGRDWFRKRKMVLRPSVRVLPNGDVRVWVLRAGERLEVREGWGRFEILRGAD